VRRYVPELKNYSDKYIYEPWKAPIADQKKWGCVIKGDGGYAESNEKNENGGAEADEDRLTALKIAQEGEVGEGDGDMMVYPKPMFDFARQREICIGGLKSAYHIGLHGNSPKVLDGTWRELFDDDAEGPTEGTKGPPGAMVGVGGYGDGDDEPTAKPAAKPAARGKRQREETPENDVAPLSKSPRTRGSVTPGRKGRAGQATLDGHVKKLKR
jgi:cryptochrome